MWNIIHTSWEVGEVYVRAGSVVAVEVKASDVETQELTEERRDVTSRSGQVLLCPGAREDFLEANQIENIVHYFVEGHKQPDWTWNSEIEATIPRENCDLTELRTFHVPDVSDWSQREESFHLAFQGFVDGETGETDEGAL